MGTDKAGDRGAAGAAIGRAGLKPRRASVVREAWDRLLDFIIAAGLGILDWLAPPRETPVDRAIRLEGEKPRKAFPATDFDNPGPRRLRSSGARFR